MKRIQYIFYITIVISVAFWTLIKMGLTEGSVKMVIFSPAFADAVRLRIPVECMVVSFPLVDQGMHPSDPFLPYIQDAWDGVIEGEFPWMDRVEIHAIVVDAASVDGRSSKDETSDEDEKATPARG